MKSILWLGLVGGVHSLVPFIEEDPWGPKIDDANLFSEENFLGRITLGNLVYSDDSSTIYEIENYLIKYEVDCSDGNSGVHPLIRDYLYMNKANEVGVAPKARYISKPNFLCTRRIGKCAFMMTDDEFELCKTGHGTLRYMVLDRVHGYYSLNSFREKNFASGAIGIENAMTLGSKLFGIIRRLHEDANLIHGKISLHNVLLSWDSRTDTVGLKLVNFGSAVIRSDDPRVTRGSKLAAQDDIIQVARIIAQLLYGNSHTYDPFAAEIIDTGLRMETRKRFEDVLLIVKSLRVEDPIPYDHLMDELGIVAKSLGAS